MNTANFIRGFLKILLLLVGIVLLFGGGACVTLDIMFSMDSSSGNNGLFIGLTIVATLVTIGGGMLIWFALRLLKRSAPN